MKVRVLLLSRYGRLGASSRVRAYQYLPYLESNGFQFTVAPMLGDDYVRNLYHGHISLFSVIRSYLARVIVMLRSYNFDLIWVEKEIFPWIPSWFGVSLLSKSIPLVLDMDDAIFHRYDQHKSALVRWILGGKLNALFRRADLVIVGNDYLGDRVSASGAKRVELLPTVVDSAHYSVSPAISDHQITIGWIGSPATAQYLNLIVPALKSIIASRSVRVVAVGANPEQLAGFPIEARPWTEKSEVSEIQQFDIGIMPLPDEPWERGKCGYKLIQYMACGKPVIASPVGVNSKIIKHGVNGFLAANEEEWIHALELLCDDHDLRQRMGRIGRQQVESLFSLDVAAPRLSQMLRSVVNAENVRNSRIHK